MRTARRDVLSFGFGCPISRGFCEKWGFFSRTQLKTPTSRERREKWGTQVSWARVLLEAVS